MPITDTELEVELELDTTTVAAATAAEDDFDGDVRWDSQWEGLGMGFFDDTDSDGDLLTFRNDILCDLNVVPEDLRRGAADVISVTDGRVVRTKLSSTADGAGFGFVSALVNHIVRAGRSVRHILVLADMEHTQEWLDSRIDQHGEGGKVMSSPDATIPPRLLNERTLLIDEMDDANLQAVVLAAGGMAVAVSFSTSAV